MPIANISNNQVIEPQKKRLIYSDKGRVEEEHSFDSVLTKEKHEKVLQDHCFGKAVHTQDYQRWAYIAEVKEKPVKSIFN